MTTYTDNNAPALDWRAVVATLLAIAVVAGIAAWQIGLRTGAGSRALPADPPISVATATAPPSASQPLPAANADANQALLTSQTVVVVTPDQAAALVPPQVPDPPISPFSPAPPRSFMVVQVQDDAEAMAVLRAVSDENALRGAHGLPLIEVRDLHDPAPRPDWSGSAAGAALAGGQAGFPIPALSEPPH